MEQNNLYLQMDLTEVANKTYDDLASKPLKSTGNTATTVVDFFHNFILYPMQKYNIYAEYKLQNYRNELIDKANKIPTKNLTLPRVNIFGPTLDGLKYNLDEEYIKDMFTNILLSDMDSTKQSKVLPSYVEIVRQLSKDDAELLQFIKENHIHTSPILKLKYNFNEGGYVYVSDRVGLIFHNDTIVLDPIIIDNLCRLQLINLDFKETLKNTSIYDNEFEKIKKLDEFKVLPNKVKELDYSKGLLKLTSFGKNFIDICLS